MILKLHLEQHCGEKLSVPFKTLPEKWLNLEGVPRRRPGVNESNPKLGHGNIFFDYLRMYFKVFTYLI